MRLTGTRNGDELFGEDDLIRGRGGNDTIDDTGAGDGRLYGDAGDDTISSYGGGFDLAYGGRGNDYVEILSGEAWGGVGNDRVGVNAGLGVGGSGDDEVYAGGGGNADLYGDEGPGLAQRTAGNDSLSCGLQGADAVRMTGGLGADTFYATGYHDGTGGVAEVMDFTPGQDLIGASVWRGYYEGEGQAAVLFAQLDANSNGVLEWSDSLSGGAVYTDGATMWLGLGATYAGPTATDAEDWLVVHGTAQLAAADWLMG